MDDGITAEKVNFENADTGEAREDRVDEDGLSYMEVMALKLKHAVPSENAFRLKCSRAEGKGMKVNTLKTNVLCMHDAHSYQPVAYIEESDGTRLTSSPGGRIKVLGFHFGDRPTVRLHVESIKKKYRQRYWTLYHLKKNGFSDQELVTV